MYTPVDTAGHDDRPGHSPEPFGARSLTPSVLAAIELIDAPDTTVLQTGGMRRPADLSPTGTETVDSRRFSCDTFVMGVASVHYEPGSTDYHRVESAVADSD